MGSFFHEAIETMGRADIDAMIEERLRYTVRYAAERSPFYRQWFREQGIRPEEIRSHEDLRKLPIISGKTIREHQPPACGDFKMLSVERNDVFTIHETSGTSGTPKTFFLTYQDWLRFAEKYARAFVSQGFGPGDTLVVCASYGMNVGANTMTLAAHRIGMTIIPEGKCTFPVRTIEYYKPTGVVGSVFKLLSLARRMKKEGYEPGESSLKRLVVGGEAFADESRDYVAEVWGCDAFNTYGSTEGTMCGECSRVAGLHVPEDLVHLDIYDPTTKAFAADGECGRMVLTTLLKPGDRCGTLLLNYDTEDTTVVVSRDRCACGRTHMRILNPQREAETAWVLGTPINRVDVERGVFQRENMEYVTGEYEAFITGDADSRAELKVRMECGEPGACNRLLVTENFVRTLLKWKPMLKKAYDEGTFSFGIEFVPPETLEIYRSPGRPKRLIDRRKVAAVVPPL
jgi:coenzyme F390 synthetase